MKDFTLSIYKNLLNHLIEKNYSLQSLENYLKSTSMEKTTIIRHDVDELPKNALEMAKIENELGIRASYYFRIVSDVFDKKIIKKIAEMGNEVGYHYEVLSTTRGDYQKAIELFKYELNEFRKIAHIKTICMHGSPLSKWDNKKLWDKFDYHDFGIIGEPYFDIDFNEVLYLTDTGRRWDGESVSVRDRIPKRNMDGEAVNPKSEIRNPKQIQNPKSKIQKSFHSTFDIIKAAKEGLLPDKMMINVHPQRWNNNYIPWFWELVSQNVKNVVKKYFYVKKIERE